MTIREDALEITLSSAHEGVWLAELEDLMLLCVEAELDQELDSLPRQHLSTGPTSITIAKKLELTHSAASELLGV